MSAEVMIAPNEAAGVRYAPILRASKPDLSIVCTVYNEQEAIPQLLELFAQVLAKLSLRTELIMVDDGSNDGSLARLKDGCARLPDMRVVELYRNYGQVKAMGAGMTFARGDWIAMLDGDLQHDPNDILRLLAELPNGHDLVATYRPRREETRLRLMVTWIGNRVNRYLMGVPIADFGSGYRLFSSRLLEMMTDRLGYVHYNTPALYVNARSYVELPITQSRRPFGHSKWSVIAFILFNLDFFIHSKRIIQVLLNIGLAGIIIGAFLYSLGLFGLAEPARAISAPASIGLTSFVVMLLSVMWREIMETQRYARGQPPFMIAGIWHDSGSDAPALEREVCLRFGQRIPGVATIAQTRSAENARC
jgi:undecaprenyl-phosphate 4-deoxy-4-formamido-L-arabinose transferase